MWIGDIETDGLLENCTKIHCAVFYNIEGGQYRIFTPDTIKNLPLFLDSINSLSMHNGIGFDLKVFKKLLNYEFKGFYIDTLLMSRILWPDIEKVTFISQGESENNPIYKILNSPHSVESWGVRFNTKKPNHEDWTVYSEEMLYRCKEDVKIQTLLYKKCKETINNYKIKDERLNKWKDIFQMEQKFWSGMEIQAENGWQFNIDKCYFYIKMLIQYIEDIDKEIDKILPKIVVYPYKDKICKAFKNNGDLTLTTFNWLKKFNYTKNEIGGDFVRVEFKKLNLNSPEQIKNFLLKEGWKPVEYNTKKDKHNKPIKDEKGRVIYTTPKLPKELEDWEKAAAETNSPSIKLLSKRNKMKHRLGLLQGLYDSVNCNRRIPAKMVTCGTPTARARHITVVNIPKSEERVFFGKECRSLFVVPENKILVGIDASALEARCESHYLYKIDPRSSDVIINGDIHSINAKIWGVERSLAKNGKYALTYGCSAKKLAITLLKDSVLSEKLYNDFWDANPALKELVEKLKIQVKSKGYLVAVDGRPLNIRYEHAQLNTLLQSAGAIVMKKAWCLFDEWRNKENLENKILDVGNFHDETQIETLPELGDRVGNKYIECIKLAGEYYNFNVPLTGEYKIGKSWDETH
jgi:hypothetical protein